MSNITMSSKNAAAALFAMLLGGIATPDPASAATISKIGGNHSAALAQNLDGSFSTFTDHNVLDSSMIPHVTILNAAGDNGFDWYKFTAVAAGRLILDIDGGMPGMDTELFLFDSAGAAIIGNDDFFPHTAGGGGSVHSFDSFIDTMINAGTYYVVVGEFNSFFTGGAFGLAGGFPDTGDSYTLHVSLQNPVTMDVPEPASGMLLVLGLAGAAAIRRRQQRA